MYKKLNNWFYCFKVLQCFWTNEITFVILHLKFNITSINVNVLILYSHIIL